MIPQRRDRVSRRGAARTRHRCGARAPAGAGARRRAGAQQCARVAPSETLAGHQGTAGGRYRRLHHRQRTAPREPQRRRWADHEHSDLGNRARPRVRRGGRSGARRPAVGRSDPASQGGQGVHARAGRARDHEFFPQRQSDCAARTRAAAHGRSCRRPGARVSRRRSDQARLAIERAPLGRHRSGRAFGADRPRRTPPRGQPARRLDRGLRRNAGAAAPTGSGTRSDPARAAARTGTRRRNRDGTRPGRGDRADRFCGRTQRGQDRSRPVQRPCVAPLVRSLHLRRLVRRRRRRGRSGRRRRSHGATCTGGFGRGARSTRLRLEMARICRSHGRSRRHQRDRAVPSRSHRRHQHRDAVSDRGRVGLGAYRSRSGRGDIGRRRRLCSISSACRRTSRSRCRIRNIC